MKNFILLFLLIPVFANAQKTHTVAAKESIYSIGRTYNIHPKEIAAYNNISMDKGLEIGQVIKIPAKGKLAMPPSPTVAASTPSKAEPVTVAKPAAPAATSTTGMQPVYHKVAKKETLYHISTLYNKVSIANIKKWNNLTSDGVNEGTDLIVGYTKGTASPVAVVTKPAPVVEVAVSNPEPKPVVKESAPVVKQEVKKPEPVVIKEEIRAVPEVTQNITGKNFNGGYFKSSYAATGKMEDTGMARMFKSTSGWEDGKYYCLSNDAPANTIVKITNPANNKSIYAKVLDVMPDMEQNKKLILQVSNAAANELGTGSENFSCTISY